MKKVLALIAGISCIGLTAATSYAASWGYVAPIQIVSRTFTHSKPGNYMGTVVCYYDQVEYKSGKYYQTRTVKWGPIWVNTQNCRQYEI